ncbi:MAG: nifR3 family TIM-barrel protein [Candidatus Berkelbacteria bacterium Athens1014_28]|uniref:tRNA-dihydrouridine synthase n=1 Tax=Candidatus Berkelbacteria bacterium Athens1014_28 TaxID=2017145 RepID=A0A554LLJ5_9BACT|nr:MAG: nifR3 family TIM-barrel protein [Candidatus Berkelbacteria bacterium Athens1014_28]
MTELVSADAVAHFARKVSENPKSEIRNPKQIQNLKFQISNNPTFKLMQFQKEEMPIVVQLFGKNPENFAKAAVWIEKNLKPAGIDINLGCPAKKVVRSGHGVALLKDPKLAVEIVKATCRATTLPVSVKTRLGFENDDEILELASKLISAGISALIIHGRTYKDGFSGEARWENIYQLKVKSEKLKVKGEKSKIKIIGNGDIRSYEDIQNKLKNLDGVAIGRGAIGNPFIFNSSFEKLSDGEKLEIKKKIALEHAKLAFEFFGDHGIIELRKHLLHYFKGNSQAKELRKKFVTVKSVEDVEGVLLEV